MDAGVIVLSRKRFSQSARCVALVMVVFIAGFARAATTGTLVLRSPVQAVATINGEGAYLLVPGQELRWSSVSAGTYDISIHSGGQKWQRQVQIEPGATETLVAALSSPGIPLGMGQRPSAPPPTSGSRPAYVPAPQAPPSQTIATPPATLTRPRPTEPDKRELERQREADRLRRQREQAAEEQRMREAQARALREEQRREREAQEQAEQKKARRPKVH